MRWGFNWKYFIATVILFIIIIAIALFIETGFIRNHFGDVIIVVFIFSFIRIFVRNEWSWLWLGIFVFAAFVEVMQFFGLVYLLGLGEVQWARVMIGVTFDPWDIVMYFVGALVVLAFERLQRRRGKPKGNEEVL
ncbi:MAG: DUF2809 domain-containing protein [Defluviitaleaceae bacterium]|nr:DUF2809 domain-containing protein [Defluviitaleaceae bacterium]MCL2273450.1 DUF2809 domain-containing protein [Defluviitaleaceae bacterium]